MVMDTEDSRVERRIALAVSTPSACILFAITKQATVVGEPTIINMAMSSLCRKPRTAAAGRKIHGSRNSLTKEDQTAPFQRVMAWLPEKDAPTTNRATGVAVAPMELSALSNTVGT